MAAETIEGGKLFAEILYSKRNRKDKLNQTMIIACTKPEWVGDGYCDDITNTIECNFDGGDCCGIYIITYYCNVCTCLEEEDSTPTTGLH